MHASKNRTMSSDKFDVYGQYIATELRALNDDHSIIMAKYYINNILLDASLGKYRINQNHPNLQSYINESNNSSPDLSEVYIIQNIG